jgi:hypothetical protein
MFGYRARIGYISPFIIELNAYDFYRIVPKGVGLIGVTCMVEGWKEDAINGRWLRSKLVRGSLRAALAISSLPSIFPSMVAGLTFCEQRLAGRVHA